MQFEIVGGSYEDASKDANNQRCVNMFPKKTGADGRNGSALVPTAGLDLLATLTDTPVRGMIVAFDDVWVVAGMTFFRLNFNRFTLAVSPTTIGTITTTVGRVSMASNPDQIIIVDGTESGFTYTNSTSVFAAISDPDFPPCSQVVFMDSYFLVNNSDKDDDDVYHPNGKTFASGSNDGKIWNALDVATAEFSTDSIDAVNKARGVLWLIGAESAEPWADTANASGYPFSCAKGLEMTNGTLAPWSVINIQDNLYFLDDRGYIVTIGFSEDYIRSATSGFQVTVISTEAITSEILDYSRVDNAIGMTYNDRGHVMYQITFPTDRKTWVYDTQTGVWHERAFYDVETDQYQEHLAQFAVQVGTHFIMGGERSGKIYLSNSKTYTDDGAVIRRIRSTAPKNSEFKLMSIDRIELRIDTGSVPADGAGSDPHISMRYSNDGTHTWSNTLTRPLGKIGEFAKSVAWNRLGYGREWIIEWSISDPISFAIMDCSANVEEVED